MEPTLLQLTCEYCQYPNHPAMIRCEECGANLQPSTLTQPIPATAEATVDILFHTAPRKQSYALPIVDAPPRSELPALMFAMLALFGAFWGVICAGWLRDIPAILAHPYALLISTMVALLFTGILITESLTNDTSQKGLLSTKQLVILMWEFVLLHVVSYGVVLIQPPKPSIYRYEFMEVSAKPSDKGCVVEAWVGGREGDELWRLTSTRRGVKSVTGVIIRRASGGGDEIPLTYATPQGVCKIGLYHLTFNNIEIDSLRLHQE